MIYKARIVIIPIWHTAKLRYVEGNWEERKPENEFLRQRWAIDTHTHSLFTESTVC